MSNRLVCSVEKLANHSGASCDELLLLFLTTGVSTVASGEELLIGVGGDDCKHIGGVGCLAGGVGWRVGGVGWPAGGVHALLFSTGNGGLEVTVDSE